MAGTTVRLEPRTEMSGLAEGIRAEGIPAEKTSCEYRNASEAPDKGGEWHPKWVGKGCGACNACLAISMDVQRRHRKNTGPVKGEFGGLDCLGEW